MAGAYCDLGTETPRSTIAACFSPCGELIASTHGDHTVKVVRSRDGLCVRTLSGHLRTPWAVKFHPRDSRVVASGSLDHEVRVWDVPTGECRAVHAFSRPISSLTFHASGSTLAVASGKRLYLWEYGLPPDNADAAPAMVLKTRRSLRAAHLVNNGHSLLLTADLTDPPEDVRELPPSHALAQAQLEAAQLEGLSVRSGGGEASVATPPPGAPAEASPPPPAETMDAEGPGAGWGGGAVREPLPGFQAPSYASILQSLRMRMRGRGSPRWPPEGQPGGGPPTAGLPLGAGQGEMPSTSKLRIWPFDEAHPKKELDIFSATAPRPPNVKPLLEIPHVVLCSEMCVDFSPCGRWVAACVVCQPPLDPEDFQGLVGIPTADLPLIYELRVYSVERGTFGEVVQSQIIRAAHCLTCIQFSPTSEHLLLAYGRRHVSLYCPFQVFRGVYTIVEVYRVRDMRLVRHLPSQEDEVNVACFHPSPGGGLLYGTKAGKLRLVRHEQMVARPKPGAEPERCLEDELLEMEHYDTPQVRPNEERAPASSDSDDD